MQNDKKIFDDFAKMINGVAGTVAGAGREAEASMRERAREWMGGLDLISREEFDAVKEIAIKARTENEALQKRVTDLEAQLASSAKKAAPKKAPTKKTTAKKVSAKKPASPK